MRCPNTHNTRQRSQHLGVREAQHFHLDEQAKTLVIRAVNGVRRVGGPQDPLRHSKTAHKVADLLGLGHATVGRILKQSREPKGNNCERKGKRGRPAFRVEDHHVDHLRIWMRAQKASGFYPGFKDCAQEMFDKFKMHVPLTTMVDSLKRYGWRVGKGKEKCILAESISTVAFRSHYVRMFHDNWLDVVEKGGKTHILPKKPIVFLDESYLNHFHQRSRVLNDETRENIKPKGRGKLWCILGAGVVFVKDGVLHGEFVNRGFVAFPNTGKSAIVETGQGKGKGRTLSRTKRNNVFPGGSAPIVQESEPDYHGHVTADIFNDFFLRLMKQVRKQHGPSVIVMDGASYHKERAEAVPTSKSSPDFMRSWLDKHQIPYDKKCTKAELYEIIGKERSHHIKLKTKIMAENHGHVVIFTPPYHPRFNPIENIWAIIKNPLLKTATRTPYRSLGKALLESQGKVTSKHWVSFFNDSMEYLKGFHDELDNETFYDDDSGTESDEDHDITESDDSSS